MCRFSFLLCIAISLLNFNSCVSQDTSSWNLDFEIWDDSTLIDRSVEVDSFVSALVTDPYAGSPLFWNVTGAIDRTSDSYSNEYALVISNFYNYSRGFAHLGGYNMRHLTDRNISKISGQFKFFGQDSLLADMFFIGFYSDQNNTVIDTIQYQFENSEEYSPFEIEPNLHYNLDSFQLYFISPLGGCGNKNYYCNFLIVDDIKIDFQNPVSTKEILKKSNINVYPNPTTGSLYIQNMTGKTQEIICYNISGSIMITAEINAGITKEIYIPKESNGIFLLKNKFSNDFFKFLKY